MTSALRLFRRALAATGVVACATLTAPPTLAQTACDPRPPFAGLRCDVRATFEKPVPVEEAFALACRHGLRIRYAKTTLPAPPGGLPMHSTHRVRPGQSADSLRTEWAYGFIAHQTHGVDEIVEKLRTPSPRMDAVTRENRQRGADQMEARAAWARSLDADSLARALTVQEMSGVVFGKGGLVRELGGEAVDGLCFPWLDVWPLSALDE